MQTAQNEIVSSNNPVNRQRREYEQADSSRVYKMMGFSSAEDYALARTATLTEKTSEEVAENLNDAVNLVYYIAFLEEATDDIDSYHRRYSGGYPNGYSDGYYGEDGIYNVSQAGGLVREL